MTDSFDALLNYDALSDAEKITGKSYKDDGDTSELGMLLHILHTQKLKDELGLRDDTYYSSSFEDALRIAGDVGFDVIHTEFFTGRNGLRDVSMLLWRAGALLRLESYRWEDDEKRSVNTADLFYNYVPPADDTWKHMHSGHMRLLSGSKDGDATPSNPWVQIGHTDVRIGFRHIMAKMDADGRFLEQWIEDPFVGLHNRSFWDKVDSMKHTESMKARYAENSRILAEIREPIRSQIVLDNKYAS